MFLSFYYMPLLEIAFARNLQAGAFLGGLEILRDEGREILVSW